MFGLLVSNIWMAGQGRTIPDMVVTDDIPDHVVNMVHDVNEYDTIDREYIGAVVESLEAAFAAQEAHQSPPTALLPQVEAGPSNRVEKYVKPTFFHIQTYPLLLILRQHQQTIDPEVMER
jgi:hypothetical protein